MAMLEEYLATQVVPNLAPGESVRYATKIALNKIGFSIALALFGVVMVRWNVAVLTTQRLLVLGDGGALIEQHDPRLFVRCVRSGIVNNRSLMFVRADGSTLSLSIWLKADRLTDQFFREVPELIERQLWPGVRVVVMAANGLRYPATIAQEVQDHFLCQMSDGSYSWFPSAAVAAA